MQQQNLNECHYCVDPTKLTMKRRAFGKDKLKHDCDSPKFPAEQLFANKENVAVYEAM
jgi:hypothetical protein